MPTNRIQNWFVVERSQVNYGFAEALLKLEVASPVFTFSAQKVKQQARMLRLTRILKNASDVLVSCGIPACDWGSAECAGR